MCVELRGPSVLRVSSHTPRRTGFQTTLRMMKLVPGRVFQVFFDIEIGGEKAGALHPLSTLVPRCSLADTVGPNAQLSAAATT
jgi:hypothetical protein